MSVLYLSAAVALLLTIVLGLGHIMGIAQSPYWIKSASFNGSRTPFWSLWKAAIMDLDTSGSFRIESWWVWKRN